MSGWASEQEAKDNAVNWCSEEKKQSYTARYGETTEPEKNMVMFKINAKTYSGVVNREFVQRLNAKLGDYKFNDGVHEFTLTEEDPMSFAAWVDQYPQEVEEEEEEKGDMMMEGEMMAAE